MGMSRTWRKLAEAIGMKLPSDDDTAAATLKVKPSGDGFTGYNRGGQGGLHAARTTTKLGVTGNGQQQLPMSDLNRHVSPQPMPGQFGASPSSEPSVGQGMGQAPRDLDPGVTRGSATGGPSPGLSRAPNAGANDRPNPWDKAAEAAGLETEANWAQVARKKNMQRYGTQDRNDNGGQVLKAKNSIFNKPRKPAGGGGLNIPSGTDRPGQGNPLMAPPGRTSLRTPPPAEDQQGGEQDWLDMLLGDKPDD